MVISVYGAILPGVLVASNMHCLLNSTVVIFEGVEVMIQLAAELNI
jgi:hypothetical protein